MHAYLDERGLNIPSKSNYHSPRYDLHENLSKSVAIFRHVKKKLVSAIFYFFTKWEPFKNYEKWFLFHSKVYFVLEIFKFLYFRPPLFFSTWPFLFDVINCLNKNSITHFVSYLEKEQRYDIEICPGIHWWKNHAENIHQKLVPG